MNRVDKIYHILVNQDSDISRRYHKFRESKQGMGRAGAWIYLLKLNIDYHFLHRRKRGIETDNFYDPKRLYLNGSESSEFVKMKPEKLAEELAQYDVISFDVFDTLILRPFSKPTDLFFLIGDKLGYMDFERIRAEMEREARKQKYALCNTSEVSLGEIWNLMEKETGIPKEIGIQTEWECEKKYCFANPYMLEVVRKLRERHKKIVITSDMYLGENYIRELLELCGYDAFDAYFVSCDYQQSKGEGKLYQTVRQKCGENLRYVHVGDNEYSDQKQAKKNGFACSPYKNVNTAGAKYREEDMSAVTGSIYRGIVNAHIHNGSRVYSQEYEFGFIYGGLFVLGYCRWIHEYVHKNKIDKILFLSRDGDIISKVYQKLYPEDNDRWEYVYWSRLAAAKMTAGYFKYDYFRRFLFHKVNQDYPLQNIFKSMELEDMLDEFLASHKDYTADSVLDEKTAKQIKQHLEEKWERVLAHYKEQNDEGGNYYAEILKDCKSAVAVDVGWAGSGAVTLDYLVNSVWNLDCSVIGLVAGTNSIYNQEPDTSEAQFFSGKLVSYMFSQEHNRDLWKFHNANRGDNMVVELLLASSEQSFRGFSKGKDRFVFSETKEEINSKEVQRGILDFADQVLTRIGDIPKISGRDAYAPIKLALKNQEWIKKVVHPMDAQMNLE